MYLACIDIDCTGTDMPSQLPLLRLNVHENFALRYIAQDRHKPPNIHPLEWGNLMHMSALVFPFDMVVASDVAYDPRCFEALVETLVHCCSPDTRVLIGHKHRYFPETHEFYNQEGVNFFDRLRAAGFEITIVQTTNVNGVKRKSADLGDIEVIEARQY
jgi:predicted nicotinamide N-methyase